MLGGNASVAVARKLKDALDGGSLADLAGQEFVGEFTVDWTTPNDADEPVTHLAYGWATQVVLVEEPQPEGPYGAKGIGEAPLVPTAAAVRAALEAFDGVHRTQLPMKDSPAAIAAVPHLVKAHA